MQKLSEELAASNQEINNADDVKEFIANHGEQLKGFMIMNCGGKKEQLDDITGQKPQKDESDCERDYYGACNAEFDYNLSRCGGN